MMDMIQAEIMVELSSSYESVVKAIASLELREMLLLKRLLDDKIQASLAEYQGNDQLILKEIESEYPTKEIIIEDFRQAWQEAMTGQTIPVSQLWEELTDV